MANSFFFDRSTPLRNLVSLVFGIPPNCHQKKRCTAMFGHYRARAAAQNPNASDEPSKQLSRYIILINSDSSDSTAESSAHSKLYSDFALLQPLFQRLFCVPASSAPVVRVFSQSRHCYCDSISQFSWTASVRQQFPLRAATDET